MSDFEDFLSQQATAAPTAPPHASTTPTDAVTPPDDFANFLAKAKGQQSGDADLQAAQAVTVANAHSGINAAAAGQAAVVGRQLGTSQAAVETDPQRYQAQAKASTNAALLSANPVLARWVAANPDSARIAQDEYGKLSAVEQLWDGTKSAGYAAIQQLGGSYAQASLATNRVLGAIPGAIDVATGHPDGGQLWDWWRQNMIDPAEAQVQALKPPSDGGIAQKAGGSVGQLLGLLSQVVLTGGGAGDALPAAAGVGETISHALATAGKSMAFPSFTTAVNTGQDVFDNTGNRTAATKASVGAYFLSTLQGVVPFSAPGGLFQRLSSGLTSGFATSEGQREAMNLLLPDSMQQKFDPQEALFQAVQGAVLGGTLGPRSQPDLFKGIRQTYVDAQSAAIAERDIGKVAALGEIAGSSHLRESDPDAFHDFVRTVSDNSSLDAVYVDAKTLGEAFAQSDVDLSKMPEVRDQMTDALATGGDVRIPIADFATHIAGTDLEKSLIPEMKASPDGMTYREGQSFYQDAVKNLQDKADEIAGGTQQTEQVRGDKQAIQQNILDQLAATKRNPDDVNRAYATLVSEGYGTMAERAGMKPSDLFAQAPLNVGAEALTGDTLNQSQDAGQRGGYDPVTRTIGLLKNADLSTFLHETGHHFLELMHGLASREGAPDGIKADFDTLLQSFGEKGDTPEERMANWSARDLNGKRAGHEQFAETFEKYLMEGKAPAAPLQPLFSRFRSWLLNVYRSLTGQGAKIDPEVKQVMDRMLASDDAIKDAEQMRSYQPLFENAKAAGMSVERFNEYLAMGDQATDAAVSAMDAKSLKDMKWLSGAKNKALALIQREAAAARKDVQAEVENEIGATPAAQAADFMRTHGGPSDEHKAAVKAWAAQRKSQLEAAREKAKADLLAANPDAKGIAKGQLLAREKAALENTAERQVLDWQKDNPRPVDPIDRSDIEMVAAMHGFKDGAAMRQAVMNLGDTRDLVKAMTDQRMLERHGELVDPQSVEMAANAAVHNEARARFMAAGLKALTDSPLPAGQIARAAKEAADRTIATRRAGDLRPDQYLAAETRANKEALAAVAADPKKAIEAQRAAILNNRLAKAAQDAKDEIERGLTYLKKFDGASTMAKAIGSEYMDRINELLSNFDVTNRLGTKQNVADRQQFRAWLDSEFARTGVRPDVSDGLLDFTQRQHWKELTVEQFRGLVDSVKSLEHVGREQTSIMIDGKRMELDALVDEAKASMATMEHNEPVDVQPHLAHATGLNKISAQFLKFKGTIRGLDAALLKIEQLFSWLDAGNRSGLTDTTRGAFAKVFSRLTHAEGAERSMRADATASLHELKDKLRGADVNLNDSLTVNLQRKGRGTQWYRSELLAAALNTGNASNLKKLAEGYGWTQDQVLREIDRHLSKTERDFVQGVWDTVGKYGPKIEALQKRLTGVAPEMIEPQRVSTRHGDYAGGYYPVVYDAFQDSHIESKNAESADKLFENIWGQPTTSKGHTVERTGYVGPLQLSLGVIGRHIDQVTHDLAWREPIIDANKFLNDKRIKSEIDQVMGREYTKQLRPWLQSMANDKVFNTAGDSAWENFIRKIRTNSTIVGLGFRLSTMEIHGLSALSTSIGEIGTKWMAKGAAQFAGIDRMADSKQFVFDRSPEMANRMNEVDRNVHDAIDDINAHAKSFGPLSLTQKAVDGARKFAFYGVSMLDMASPMPTWYGAYLKGMAHEGDGGHGMSEADAIEYANRAVRNAHGGGGAKDLAAVQRSKGTLSLATMFYSFWNHMYNRQRDLGAGYANLGQSFKAGTGVKDFSRLLARSWWYFVVPQLIHALLKPESPSDEKDDDGSLSHFLGHAAKEVGLGFVSGVPVLRDMANAAINGRDYAVTPLEAAGKSLVKASTDAYKAATGEETSKHPVQNAAQAVGYTFGLPTGQASTTGRFLWDVYDGDADPQSIKDWYTGIANGRISE